MSPSAASASTKAGSFFSSPVWKRVFSRQQDVAVRHRRDRRFGHVADAVVGEGDRHASDAARSAAATGLQRLLRRRARLRAAEMRQQDDLAALCRRSRRSSARARSMRGRIGDRAVLHRHVEVDPHQHALAGEVDVVEGAKASWLRRASDQLAHGHGGVGHAVGEAPFVVVPATSRARTLPSITLVWSMWKIDECGSWLKSIETLRLLGVAENALERPLGGGA